MAQTWADVVELGRGAAEFRLRIEGVAAEFCTSGMALGGSGDFVRYHGLRREGLGFSESCYFAGAEQSVTIQPITIDDQAGAQRGTATALFSRIARVVDQLQVTLSASDSACTVRDSSLLPTFGYLGTETLYFDPTTGTTADVGRGQMGSTAQAHYVSLGGPRPSVTPIYDHPSGFVGRRVWLYAHGAGELALGDAGAVVWRGVIGKEPSESDGLWTLQVESRIKQLDGSLAAGFDKLKLRGCYYPERWPFSLSFARRATAAKSSSISATIVVNLSGFFETRRLFLDALITKLTADVGVAWGLTFEGRETTDGTWDLYLRTAAAPQWITVFGGSAVDGVFRDEVLSDAEASFYSGSSGSPSGGGPFTAYVSSVATGVYRLERFPIEDDAESLPGLMGGDLRRLPCHNTGGSGGVYGGVAEGVEGATWPSTRLYLASVSGVTTEDIILLTPLGEDEGQELRIFAVVAGAAGYVSLSEGAGASHDPTRGPRALAAGGAQPTLAGAAVFAGGDGDLEDFRAALISRAPAACNLGSGPWVTADDLSSWGAAVAEAAGGRQWALHRTFAFGKAQRTIDVLREEWRLLGVIPYLDAEAKLAIRPLTFETRAPDYEISAEHRVVDDGFGMVAGDDDGLVTTTHWYSGYDPIEDKHNGDQIIVRNVSAISRVHAERTLEIKPMSNAVGEDIDPADAYTRGLTLTEIFGARRTQTVAFDVTLRMFPVLVGDAVLITIPQLPGDGTRGIWTAGGGLTGRTGYVVSRSWDLDAGVGTLRVLLHELAIAGYTPSGKVSAASGAGDSWTLTLTAGHYSGTASDAQFFVVNDSIRLVEWDADAPVTREGAVTLVDVAAEQVSVLLKTSWVGTGGSRYTLSWDTSGDPDTQASQLEAVYLAGPTGRVTTTGPSQASKRFAP